MLSFKASTCLAPGDCGALIPVLAQSFCGPGQVTSSSEEGIHQVPHGPAEMAKGCKTILSSNGRRGRLEGLSAVLSQLPATAPEVLVLRQGWGGLLWVTVRRLQASNLVSRPMLPLTRAILKSLGAKYRQIFSPSSLVLQLCDTSYCQTLQVVRAGLANPLSGAQHFSLVCHSLPLTSEIFFSFYRFLIMMYSHFAINHRYFSIYH